jgi:beta-lactamase regulating signal transducer with metallopeptidase domain/parvulin-like peptidyl-prolyl isomerase
MIPEYLSAMWSAIAPAVGNHLWQSTLFAGTAGLLTLPLRKDHARVRYWLWLTASVKFLIPFSLLVGIGSHLAWSRNLTGTKAGLYFAMGEVGTPFTQPPMSMISPASPSTVSASLIHLLPALLAAAWLCGFVAVLFVWHARWKRIASALRGAAPLREGREVAALRRVECIAGMGKKIEMLSSVAPLEPGIFGIVRPVLVWPEGISEHLEDAHLEAILAHEVWHVRRRDNLAAAIHMMVEAIFWFYPLVWWLGAPLLEERERACDEGVLEFGSDRQVYAESILKICEFCVGSPLACVSGVTGADLKKRMVCIMTKRVARKLDFSRKLLLSAAGFVAVVVPIVFGLVNATPSRAQLLPARMRAQAKTAADADVVARVNKDVITLSDYQKAEQHLRDQLAHDCQGCPQDQIDAQFKRQQKDLLRGMIDQSLMVQRAKDLGISVESDLDKRLDEVRQQNGLATLDDLKKGVEASGFAWEDYKTTIRNGLLQKEVVRREVDSRMDIRSDEVKQYYEAHPQEFTLPERVVLSEISLSTEGKSPEEIAAVRIKADGLRTSILNGEDFSQAARLYSQGSTAKNGGGLGTFKKGELAPQLEAIVFQLSKGQINDVSQTRTGFEILKVEDHLQAGLQPMDKVEPDIVNIIHTQKMQPRMRDYLAALRKQSNIIVTPGYQDSALLSGSNVPSPDKSHL